MAPGVKMLANSIEFNSQVTHGRGREPIPRFSSDLYMCTWPAHRIRYIENRNEKMF